MIISELRDYIIKEYGYSPEEVTIISGIMGVPISFLDKYCPEQFEMVGCANHGKDNEYDLFAPTIDGREIFKRILIRKRQ